MKRVLFGNPHTDWWELSLDGISRREQVIALTGELHVGFFSALTPMSLPPSVLQAFASQLELLDKTLSGRAVLQNSNDQSEVHWVLEALPHGHVESSGHYHINRNNLAFSFRTDQTQLTPLLRWIRGLLASYDKDDSRR